MRFSFYYLGDDVEYLKVKKNNVPQDEIEALERIAARMKEIARKYKVAVFLVPEKKINE